MKTAALAGWVLIGAAAACLSACGGAAHQSPPRAAGPGRALTFPRQEPFVRRIFRPFGSERRSGEAVAYGPHRDGQHPGGPSPGKAELRQDLRLMFRHWRLLRVYGAVGPPETILEVIREDGLDMRVMLGIWIAPEERRDAGGKVLETIPGAREANRREIESAIQLAAAYPEIVTSISVGNETQVSWSAHRVPPELLIHFVREVRARTTVPITVADDFNFWNKPESRPVAQELDFIVTHAHPLWNGIQLEGALDWTRRTLAEVQAAHPGQTVVLGETGWATSKIDEGDQGKLIKGQVGEEPQAVFYRALQEWLKTEPGIVFVFEAFDENWKGGANPGEVEKHWGLYRSDRTPKLALAGGG